MFETEQKKIEKKEFFTKKEAVEMVSDWLGQEGFEELIIKKHNHNFLLEVRLKIQGKK